MDGLFLKYTILAVATDELNAGEPLFVPVRRVRRSKKLHRESHLSAISYTEHAWLLVRRRASDHRVMSYCPINAAQTTLRSVIGERVIR